MNELQQFNFEGLNIRTLVIENEPFFVGKDVADVLGYSNSRDALAKHVDDEDKNTVAIRDGIGNPNKTVINESGLYSLIILSKLPNAKKFKRWVTSDVLPSIRKTGSYNKPISTADQVALALKGWQEHDERLNQVEDEMNEIKDSFGLPANQAAILKQARARHIVTLLGGKDSNAYPRFSKVVFAEFGSDFKNYFDLSRYDSLPLKRFDEGLEYTRTWQPSTNTALHIRELNAQMKMEV